MYKYISVQYNASGRKFYFFIFMAMCNPETGNILSKLKTVKTLCAAFPAQVRELVRELNGE